MTISFHGLAELLLAGPQHRRSGTIRLRVTETGFATVAEPDVRVEVDALIVGGRRIAFEGHTFASLAAEAGLDVGAPVGVYPDGSGAKADDPVDSTATTDTATADSTGTDGEAAANRQAAVTSGAGAVGGIDAAHAIDAAVLDALIAGDAALRAFAPDRTPVLWPEHFDVAVSVGEVNYGVSAGDATVPEPYAYVGPWTPRTGPFWTESFGAARPVRELVDAAAITAFFEEGQQKAAE